jgi:hypothetical protein
MAVVAGFKDPLAGSTLISSPSKVCSSRAGTAGSCVWLRQRSGKQKSPTRSSTALP